MIRHTKHEAEVRLSMGVARIAMRGGRTPQEAMHAVRNHLDLMKILDRPAAHDDDTTATYRKRSVAD
ncbi:UNVERIFIED_ORG: hypothetical protein LHK14_26075 (plasmid) [Roseateles sp. XES5]|nr:hypothetical protein [Roseateles sp. XES5]